MNKREEQIRKEFWVDKKPQQTDKKEITEEEVKKFVHEFNFRMFDLATTRPMVMTGDATKILGAAGYARAGKPCNKSIKSTQELGKESIEELKDKENMDKVRSNMENQKDNIKEQEDGIEQE